MPPTRKNKSHEMLQTRPYQPSPEQKKERSQRTKSKNNAAIVVQDDDNNNDDDDDDDDGDNDEEGRKTRGSWTAEKQLALLQKYAEYFPPGALWEKSTEAWQKVVDGVNAVAPNDTPLRYDACRRAVDRISDKYIKEESIQKAALETLTLKDKYDEEKVKKLVKQESNRERKRMKRLIIQRLAKEKSTVADQITKTGESDSNSLPADATESVSNIYFNEAFVREQREFQQAVLVYMENMSNVLEGVHELLKKKG